ncbi:TetR/AcrR family transcriptional regulator [Celeribacter sp. ULVN23_4]
MTQQSQSTVQDDPTTARILAAAIALFLEKGLRGTSMEAIAKAASVAKPTLYGRFKSKDEVFAGVVSDAVGKLREAVSSGLATEGTAAEKIAAGLNGKYRVLEEMLGDSPHAADLITAPKHLANDAFERFERDLRAQFADILAKDRAEDADHLAGLVIACADGINRLGAKGSVFDDIRFMVSRILAT